MNTDSKRAGEKRGKGEKGTGGERGPSLRYPLFEHVSAAHGLTLLDSEMDEIIRVCRGIDRDDLWIPVIERLPETAADVLVYVPGYEPDRKVKRCVWAGYHDGRKFKPLGTRWFMDPVTHWREFPEPPQEGNRR